MTPAEKRRVMDRLKAMFPDRDGDAFERACRTLREAAGDRLHVTEWLMAHPSDGFEGPTRK